MTIWAGLCPLCREALVASSNEGLIQGFYLSILLLVSTPLVLVTAFLLFLYRASRRRRPAA